MDLRPENGIVWLKKLAPKRKRKEKVAAESVSGAIDAGVVPPTNVVPLNDVILARAAVRESAGHVGMQGYRPIIGISRNRARCEGCREVVKPGIRHICIYNAHHHIDTLTAEERSMLIEQLKLLGVKTS